MCQRKLAVVFPSFRRVLVIVGTWPILLVKLRIVTERSSNNGRTTTLLIIQVEWGSYWFCYY
jgi:hypothetical protein